MNIEQESLVILAEECGEVVQECSKMLRFGNPPSKLEKEIGDLLEVISIMDEHGIISLSKAYEHQPVKRQKLIKWSSIVSEADE